MNSGQAKSTGEKSSAPPTFSYAQAAKGRSFAATTNSVHLNQPILSGPISTVKDASSVNSTPSQGHDREEQSVSESFDASSRLEVPAEIISTDTKATGFEMADSAPSSPDLANVSVSLSCKDDDKFDDSVLSGSTSDMQQERNSSGRAVYKMNEGNTDSLEGKKGKRQKSTEIEVDREEVKTDVLVPAPLPAVNFWQQRKEKFAKISSTQVSHNPKPSLDAVSNYGPANSSIKYTDPKKRSKQSGTDSGERQSGQSQNGGFREASTTGRSLKKGGNGPFRFKEDQQNKRNGTRGGRQIEKEEKLSSSLAPPPVEDASSWPTPETVFEEDKRKVQGKHEREERDDSASNRPRQKEKWVPVPYIPTVTFNTPIPTRGGRTRGGTRAGRGDPEVRLNHGQTHSVSGEKSQSAPSDNANTSCTADKIDTKEPNNTTSAPSKRQLGDTSNTRKSFNAQFTEKVKSNHSRIENHSNNEYHHSTKLSQPDQRLEESRDSKPHPGEISHSFKQEQNQAGDISKSSTTNRRSESNMKHSDNVLGKDNQHQSRDRVEGRTDRSRGGYRGRGGHSSYTNGHSHHSSNYSNGVSTQHQNGYSIRQGPYSPPLAPPFNAQFVPASRNGRVGPRSQSIPSSGIYGRYSQNNGSVSQTLASIQSPTPIYDYAPMQQLSATPYPPFIDHVSVHAMVTMQLEYYFSIDNLCKDVYLRKHMDSQGFVFLSFIAGFKRIQALTQDFELIRFACHESDVIELVRGEDGIDRLRRKEGWEKWVLTMDERDESTKNPGPTYWHPPQYNQKSQYIGQMILTSPHPSCMIPYPGSETNYSSFNKDGSVIPLLNGTEVYQPQTPLSAAVADFAPSLPPIDVSNELLEAENTFQEDEVANLTLVFASPNGSGETKPRTSIYHPSSRTFSNGSIDRRSFTESFYDDSQPTGQSLLNGSHGSET